MNSVKIKKNQKSKIELGEHDKAVRRVLAPFLSRYKKAGISGLSEIKEEFRNVYMQTKPAEVLARLDAFFTDSLELPTVLNETAEILKSATKSIGVSVYLVDETTDHIVLIPKHIPRDNRQIVRYRIEPETTVAAYTAFVRQFVASEDILGDPRFPQGVPGTGTTVKVVLCVPVLTTADGKCIAVIELYREVDREPYNPVDFQLCVAMAGWMGAAIHQNSERLFLLKRSELNKCLLSLIQLFFSEVITFDKLVSDIVMFAKTSVGAERGSLFVVDRFDTEDDVMVVDVYEEGLNDAQLTFKKKHKQRFYKHLPGIPGYVARTGKIVNIPDAYQDPKFNKSSDLYGFRTRSVVGVPIKSTLGIFGVLQLVNKFKEPRFTQSDEILLEIIAEYVLLACHYANIEQQFKKSSSRYKGSLEMLEYHMRPCPDILKDLTSASLMRKEETPEGFFDFDWYLSGYESSLNSLCLFAFDYILGIDYFDRNALIEFIVTVRKCYREIPYHNFEHAFTVFHCMFNIIHRNSNSFTNLEKLSLLISTLCHDADHIGFTNNFLDMTGHWLAELYSDSYLENHHYYVCIMIITNTKVLSALNSEEYQKVIKLIKWLIISTDLANYFRQRAPIVQSIKNGTFDWDDPRDRVQFMGMIMTCCDMSGQCKPFQTASKVTEGLYREFYKQGDTEKELGLCPLAMLDRNKMSQIPEDQIQFLTIVCIPCIEILVSVFSNTYPLLVQCMELKERWSDIISKRGVEIWRPADSVVLEAGKRKRTRSPGRIINVL